MRVTKLTRNLRIILMPVIAIVALLCFASAVGNLGGGQNERGAAQLEEAIRRSGAAYYASEGAYPTSLDALTEKYGIQIDDRYTVYYTFLADNLMPDITVLEKK